MPTVSHIPGRDRLGELVAGLPGADRLAHLLSTFRGDPRRLGAFTLDDGRDRRAFMPYLLQSYPLPCRVGELRLFGAPLRRMRLLHEMGCWPESANAYRALLDGISEVSAPNGGSCAGWSPLDVVWLPAVPTESALGRFLAGGAAGNGFHRYCPSPPVERHQIRLPATFNEYQTGHSTKSRATQHRKMRRLLGQTAHSSDVLEVGSSSARSTGLVRVTHPADVPWLVERMVAISRKTYQYNLLGLGVRDAQQLARDAESAARQQRLRAYLLMVDGQTVAFLYGLQFGGPASAPHAGTYDYIDVGHDPAWSAHSPGTVLLSLVIEDLYRWNTPAVFDFGPGYGEHKRRFGNCTLCESEFYLFRRTARAFLARGAHAACTRASLWAGAALDRVRLKASLRHTLRRWAGST